MTIPLLHRVPTRRLLTVVGAVSLLGALLLAFAPVPLDGLRGPVSTFANRGTIFLLGATAAVLGTVHLYRSRGDDRVERVSFGVPEAANYDSAGSTGGDIDETIADVDGTLSVPDHSDWWTQRDRKRIADELRSVAVPVVAEAEDCSHAAAAAKLDTGTWTDDPRARHFLGDHTAPEPPLRMQFYDWLSGEAYDRHVEHTVDEIAARAGVTEVETA